jgi:hypothetical protein
VRSLSLFHGRKGLSLLSFFSVLTLDVPGSEAEEKNIRYRPPLATKIIFVGMVVPGGPGTRSRPGALPSHLEWLHKSATKLSAWVR